MFSNVDHPTKRIGGRKPISIYRLLSADVSVSSRCWRGFAAERVAAIGTEPKSHPKPTTSAHKR
jgi:hypothetical protein